MPLPLPSCNRSVPQLRKLERPVDVDGKVCGVWGRQGGTANSSSREPLRLTLCHLPCMPPHPNYQKDWPLDAAGNPIIK